jgi:hypothetical protein
MCARRSAARRYYFRTYPNGGSPPRRDRLLDPGPTARGRGVREQLPDRLERRSRHDLHTLGDRLQGTTVTGNNLVLTLNAEGAAVAESCSSANAAPPSRRTRKRARCSRWRRAPASTRTSSSSRTATQKILDGEIPCAMHETPRRSSTARPRASTRPGRRSRRSRPPPRSTTGSTPRARPSTTRATAPSTARRSRTPRTRPGRPEAYGNVNLVEAYQHSINAVFCNIGQKLGVGES